MSTIQINEVPIEVDRFDFVRLHLHRKVKTHRKGLDKRGIYLRKKLSRLKRANKIDSSEEVQQFFAWIWEIQRRLKLNNLGFALRIGVSLQTLKLWRNSHGHFPSDRSYRMLLLLDREANITKEELKVIFGEKSSVELINNG